MYMYSIKRRTTHSSLYMEDHFQWRWKKQFSKLKLKKKSHIKSIYKSTKLKCFVIYFEKAYILSYQKSDNLQQSSQF